MILFSGLLTVSGDQARSMNRHEIVELEQNKLYFSYLYFLLQYFANIQVYKPTT